MTTLQSIADSIAQLPDRQEWRNGFDSIRSELRSLIRPPKPRRRAIPPRTWHAGAGWPGIGTALVGSEKLEDVLTAPGRNLQESAQVEERAWHGHKYLSTSAL